MAAMTDAVTPRDVVSTDWWDHRPVFSVADKASRITGLAPRQAPGRLTVGLLAMALVSAATWTALTLLASSVLCSDDAASCFPEVSQGWVLIGGLLVLGYASLYVTVDLAERARSRLGQRRAASLFYMTPLLAGIAVGAGSRAVSGLGPDPEETLRRTLDGQIGTEGIFISGVVAIAFAIWGLTVVARLPGALHHARKRQATIERLRRDGYRCAGVLHLGGIRFWLHNAPELDVTVTYESPAGRQHEVAARMRTTPDCVPKDRSKVVVLTDLQGDLHVELDRDAEPEFEPEERYTPSE
jgi:hypothetical protein